MYVDVEEMYMEIMYWEYMLHFITWGRDVNGNGNIWPFLQGKNVGIIVDGYG